jgi:hypothetical protein
MRVLRLALGILLLARVLLGQQSERAGDAVRPLGADETKAVDASSNASQVTQTPGTTVAAIVEAGFDASAKTAQDEAERYALTVRTLMRQQNFDELDRMADEARRGKPRFAGGGWKLYQIYSSLATMSRRASQLTDSDWREHLERFQKWVLQKPESITARVALAEAYENYAWFARLPGLADAVTREGSDLFSARMKLARATLEQASGLKQQCPHWFYVMQEAQFALNEGDPISLLKQAMACEPSYYYYYSTDVRYLLPKWYGKEGDAAKFAATVSDQIGGSEGDFIYFQIAAGLNHKGEEERTAVRKMDWARIMRGFLAMERQYGISDLRLNQIARLALSFSDPIIGHEMLTRLGDNWSPGVWEEREFFDNSKDWANRGWLQSLSPVIDANMQSMEGLRYQEQVITEFSGKFHAAAEQCAETGNELSQFYMFLQIGGSGKVQLLYAEPGTKVSNCLGMKVAATTFSPPPKPSYWVKILVDTVSLHPTKSVPALQ